MSKRDHGLLAAVGLSVAEAAKLFNRSRQAIYSGMSAASDNDGEAYFSAHDAMWLLQYAKQCNSGQLDQLLKFIESNYPQSETALVLQDQVGYEQVRHVVNAGGDVIIAFNGSLEELEPNSTFAKILTDLLSSGTPTRLLLSAEWVVAYIEQRLKLKAPKFEVRSELSYLPSFVLIREKSVVRAFFFQRFSPEECKPNVAEGLWSQFAPTSSENDAGRLLAAG